MCCTLHESRLSSTYLYAGEARRGETYVHVLGYQNTADNISPGPNAMILPIPAKTPLTEENAIDTRSFKDFLHDMSLATKSPDVRKGVRSDGVAAALNSHDALVFDVGSYTVVIAETAGKILTALKRVPESRRPQINIPLMASFTKNYTGWPIAVCCWEGHIEAEPLLFWYEPKMPDKLFAPALDAHDGNAPSDKPVNVDHVIMFGSTLRATGYRDIGYTETIPEDVRSLLPTRAVGEGLFGDRLPNGDFWYDTMSFEGGSDYRNGWRPTPALRAFPGPDQPVVEVPLGRW